MSREEEIVSTLCAKFPHLTDRISVKKAKRLFTDALSPEEFQKILPYVHKDLGFSRATHVVGTDNGDSLGLLYILANEENILLMLRECVSKENPVVQSIIERYPSIELHERELVDLFGVTVLGLPEGPRYPLPDGWPDGSYPLRKEWDPKCFNKDTMVYTKPQEKELGQK